MPGVAAYLAGRGLPTDRVVYIPNGVDLGVFDAPVAEPNPAAVSEVLGVVRDLRAEGRFVFGYVGSFGRVNRLDVIIAAAAAADEHTPGRIGLVIVGDGPERADLERLSAAAPGVVTIAPAVPKRFVPTVLRALDAAVVHATSTPVYRYGISFNKLFEYMAAGRPVLFACDSAYDPVADVGAGISVKPDRPDLLADAMGRLIGLPAEALVAMGAAGRACVEREHNIDGLASRLADAIDGLSGPGRGANARFDGRRKVTRPESSPRAVLLRPGDPEWDATLNRSPHDIYHTAGFHRWSEEAGEGTAYLAVVGNATRGLAWPYLLRGVADVAGLADAAATDVTSVYGYPGPVAWGVEPGDTFLSTAWAAIRDAWRSQGVVAAFTRFHPILGNAALLGDGSLGGPDSPRGGVLASGDTVSIDATIDDAAALAGYNSNHRRDIRAARAAGLATSHDDDWAHLADWARLYRETMVRAGAAESYFIGSAAIERLRDRIGDALHLFVVQHDDRIVAAGLFLECQGIVQTHLIGTDEAALNLSPYKVLLDDVRGWAHRRGDRMLHLGGGRGGQDDSLMRFKAGFSKRRHPFHTGRWVLDPDAYAALDRAHRTSGRGGRPACNAPTPRAPGIRASFRPTVPHDHDRAIEMSELRYHLARPDARLEAAVAWIAQVLGVRARAAVPPELWAGPHLVHGSPDLVREQGIAIPDRPADRFWDAALDGGPGFAPVDVAFPFDVLGAIAAFLGDADHADPAAADPAAADLDEHGRLRLDASTPFLAGRGDVPVVNTYVAVLGAALAVRGLVGRPRWPDGKRAAIALSHDVDRPDRYALLESAWRPWRFRRSPRGYVETTLALARARLRDRDPSDQWRFDDIVAFERGLQVRSTFYFSVTPFHRPWADGVDVAYDAGSRRFRRVMHELVDDGFEVGLHASYNAFESSARLRSERERLSRLAGTEVRGLRHHYWHLGPDIATDAPLPRGGRLLLRHVDRVQRTVRLPAERRAAVPAVRCRPRTGPANHSGTVLLNGRGCVLDGERCRRGRRAGDGARRHHRGGRRRRRDQLARGGLGPSRRAPSAVGPGVPGDRAAPGREAGDLGRAAGRDRRLVAGPGRGHRVGGRRMTAAPDRPSRRALMILYHFPPIGGISMSRNIRNVQYLPEHGWQPVPLTPRDVVETTHDPGSLAMIPPGVEVRRTGAFETRDVAPLIRDCAPGPRAPHTARRHRTRAAPRQRHRGRDTETLADGPPIASGAGTRPGRHPDPHPAPGVLSGQPGGLATVRARRRPQGPPRGAGRRRLLDVPADDLARRCPVVPGHHRRALGRRVPGSVDRQRPRGAAAMVHPPGPPQDGALGGPRRRPCGRGHPPARPDARATVPGSPSRPRPQRLRSDRGTEPEAGTGGMFRIVYTGTLDRPTEFRTFLEGLDQMALARPDLRDRVSVDLYGVASDACRAIAAARATDGASMPAVHLHGFVPKARAIEAIRDADAALVLLGDGPNMDLFMPGKLLEYLGLGRRIVAMLPPGDARDLLERLSWGVLAEPHPSSVADALIRVIDTPPPTGGPDPEGTYDRRRIAAVLAGVLDAAVDAAADTAVGAAP